MKCKDSGGEVTAIYLIDPKDIKSIGGDEGLKMKRKYGNFKREVTKLEWKKDTKSYT